MVKGVWGCMVWPSDCQSENQAGSLPVYPANFKFHGGLFSVMVARWPQKPEDRFES